MNAPRKIRVLVVEDDPLFQLFANKMLPDTIYTVEMASSLAEALAKLETRFYHLILLDIRLQENDSGNEEGMQLLRLLGTGGENRLGAVTKIVMWSSYGTSEWMREAFR